MELKIHRGDVFYIQDSGYYVGSEMAKTRPAVIVSNEKNNQYFIERGGDNFVGLYADCRFCGRRNNRKSRGFTVHNADRRSRLGGKERFQDGNGGDRGK